MGVLSAWALFDYFISRIEDELDVNKRRREGVNNAKKNG